MGVHESSAVYLYDDMLSNIEFMLTIYVQVVGGCGWLTIMRADRRSHGHLLSYIELKFTINLKMQSCMSLQLSPCFNCGYGL